jgi:hypothetical protein
MPSGGYAGHSGEIMVRPPRRGPSAGTLVAIIVAIVLVSIFVGAVIAFVQSGKVLTLGLDAPAASAYVGGTDSGGQSTP